MLDEIKRKAALHGGWIDWAITWLCGELDAARVENERLRQRIRALEESAVAAQTLFDEEEQTDDTRS